VDISPPRTPRTNTVIEKKSDPDCFSTRTDQTKGESLKCECGDKGYAGSVMDSVGSVIGKGLILTRIYCSKCATDKQLSIFCSRMYPGWKVVADAGKGKYWLRHRTEKEQAQLILGK
jgi:hypothetical protein